MGNRVWKMTGLAFRSWRAAGLLGLALVFGFGLPGACLDAAAETKDEAPTIAFFDSSPFDSKLSAALKKEPPVVRVEFPAPVTVNEIPERVDKWLSQVEEYGGTVELRPEDTTRGIIGMIIDLIIGSYRLAQEKMLYGPVEDYNAEVWYKKEDGRITKILFVRKEPPAS